MSDFFDDEDDDGIENYSFSTPKNSSEFTIYGIVPSDKILDAYNLILREKNKSGKMVSITIGGSEAQSIAIFLEAQNDERMTSRPFSHDLFVTLMDKMEGRLLYVVIDGIDFEKNSFDTVYSSIIVQDEGGHIVLDSRPSDAISISLRADAPIFITNDVIMNLSKKSIDSTDKPQDEFEDHFDDIEEGKEEGESMTLQDELDAAIKNEDYEAAAKIRDKMKYFQEGKDEK